MRAERNSLEIADIFHKIAPKVSELKLSPEKRRVFRALTRCRTAALGAHVHSCTSCGYREQSYNSCLNRHCPKCRGSVAFEWVRRRSTELLPVPYYHVVFTLPSELRALCYANKRIMYELLFKASNESLSAAAQRREGVQLGAFGVLHTWNQELQYHPHVHYVVAAGGLTAQSQWKSFAKGERFFLPVRVLSRLFRGKFIYHVKKAYHAKRLFFPKHLSYLSNPLSLEHLMSQAAGHEWVVYSKRPFGNPEQVVKYLGSYVHRVAISRSRLSSITDKEVRFKARDPKRKHKKRVCSLTLEQFTKRFLLHVLPRALKRIRYFGFMTNERRARALATIRVQLGILPIPVQEPLIRECPQCPKGSLLLVACLKPHRMTKIPMEMPRRLLCLGLSPPVLI